MNKVSDIIARKGVSAIAVPPDTTVVDALRIMAEKNIGSVLVMHALLILQPCTFCIGRGGSQTGLVFHL